ncbi:hypothetical protein F441_02202 [Phytophthora nicotianae CJ01A1]|uniref:mRNA decay factor PAT1 domain-containing protein n=3 Tax=Phytophthora nicotianae TaxID=4792 RepID=V9FWB5_PHYNI|nr:hypothetical protein F443_02230 [Phytophthora nicotianae P1569]ETK94874.1 hypothetical protein L915_02139 [Phytophthora nicotianae]ETL48267.1 hypothetical protein L916_02103 [Phytophthora nicotianae]ETP24859.1 hypothetical protein F441_02202 [Phytophthora nicotianae CJ01A1]
MASEDSVFGSSLDGLPAFFTNGSVDDTKYESLLADLRAHDLLGPVESGAQASDAGGSSLFFNDAFSAVFMGNFQSGATKTSSGSSGRAPPGLAAPSDDIEWARGQQEFSKLEEKFHGSTAEKSSSATAGRAPPPGLSLEQDSELDESQVPGLSGLGLDDDDSVAGNVQPTQQAPPPLPQAPPVPAPPMPPQNVQPPNAWGAPPMAPPNAQQLQQQHPQQFMPPPPPHMQGQPPHPMYMQGPPQGHPMPPPQGMYPGGPPPPPQFFGRGPPPPMRPPYPGPPGAFGRNGPPHPPPQMHPPAFKMMTPRDVNFVMQQQMKWLRSSDPFSDDYYFHNYMQKRTRAGVPGRSSVPLPSWKLQHVKSVDPRDVQREVKSRNWESEYHVLGRNAKSSLYRPKQLLNLAGTDETSSPPASSPTSAEDPERTPSSNGEGETEDAASATAESSSEAASSKHVRGSSPGAQAVAAEAQAAKVLRMSDDASHNSVFANDTWKLRLQLDRGMQCLLSLQDARHLLDARGINVQQFHSMNEDEMDPALVELRSRTTSLLLELASLLGVNVMQAGDADSEAASRGVMSCDVQQLQKMLAATKGKMLVSRALPLLHPSARFVLLPHLVDHLLSGRTDAGRQTDVNDAGDDRLCQTLVLMLLYVPPAPPAELLTECLQRALNGHNVQSLSVVLHNRARAESLQALLQRGGSAVQQLTQTEGADAEHANSVKQQWEHHQNVFVQLATAIKQAA